MKSYEAISRYFIERAEQLANEVVSAVVQKINLDIPDWEKEQAIEMYIEFLSSLGYMLEEDGDYLVPDTLVEWSKKNAERQAAAGGNISEIVVRYPPTREAFNEILTRISREYDLSIEENAYILKQIDAMLDISLNETVFAFEELSATYREETEQELAELSAPVVPVKEDVVILSLSGEIDNYRSDHIMTHVIPKISEMGIDHVIVDFSGIYTVNAEVANSLYQIGRMFRVMGIEVCSTGLRPEIVQTVVQSGIDLSTVNTFANVKQALESIK